MKILYGVQATGNGHLSRGREMAKHFAENNMDVEFLISGRDKKNLHDMELFGDYQYYPGITFQTKNGRVQAIKTAFHFSPVQLYSDAMQLDLDAYDLIISDFEPVTAWAAKLNNRTCIGIGHQYAFDEHTPRVQGKWLSSQIMKYFAPASTPIGLHWHRFNTHTLPPIINPHLKQTQLKNSKKIVVYLPFENQNIVSQYLTAIPDFQFYQYAPGLVDDEENNISLRAPSVAGFHNDLTSCSGVICNTGFELISECIHLGVPVLTTPLKGQVEQLSNAIALQELGMTQVEYKLSTPKIRQWLHSKQSSKPKDYPDVAQALVQWIKGGRLQTVDALSKALWTQTQATAIGST